MVIRTLDCSDYHFFFILGEKGEILFMAKQLNVKLGFQADTSQAKAAIQDLQMSLSKISMGKVDAGIDPSKIKQASAAAKDLSIHLNNAYNADTGNFDLSKLNKSLKTSKQNIQSLSTELLKAGSSGEQAFVKLAQSIASADRPLITINSKLKEFGTTLANTARWQISSSILHGFMGTVQKAYGYAQDLNESLNNIRIVTGHSVDEMSQFAEKANKAAKALSTTTTEYTDASLIYFQQGLSGREVEERTEATIKMANVTGQSAQVVSDQMTAVWNNFDDGSKSLEYYADVMTALGAATASSTDEIADGLEKFAAVADTVGLSYEYAASALATVTATTRQSADVVGTAFKTLFARIEGLSLGETLEDGTTLNKYSEALLKVGVNIKDANGDMKAMDQILSETANKWETLGKDQQIALAQTVAGVRQYTQFIALMDNWDFMEENLSTSKNATGVLDSQQKIYEESWKAASDRVKASMESIYSDIIDDEFFIDITNGFAKILNSVDAFIDGAGGIKTILLGIGSFFLSHVAGKIQPAIRELSHNFSVMFSSAEQQSKALGEEMNETIDKTLKSDLGQSFSDSNKVALQNAMAMNKAKASYMAVEDKLTKTEQQRYSQELSMIEVQQKETQEVADRITKLKQEKEAILDKESVSQLSENGKDTATKGYRQVSQSADLYKEAMHESVATDNGVDYAIEAYMAARNAADQYKNTQDMLIESTSQLDDYFRQLGDDVDLTNPINQVDSLNTAIQEVFSGPIQELNRSLDESSTIIDENATSFTSFQNQIELVVASMPKVVRESEPMQEALEELFRAKDSEGLRSALSKVEQGLKLSKVEAKDFAKVLKEVNPSRYRDLSENAKKTSRELDALTKKQAQLNKAINEFNPKHTVSGIERITSAAAGFGQVAMAAQSLRSIFQAWSNDDLSFGEKITTTLTGLSMVIPSAIGGIKSLNAAFQIGNTTILGSIAAHKANLAVLQSEAAQTTTNTILKRLSEAEDKKIAATAAAKLMVKKGLIAADQEEAYAELFLATAKQADNLADGQSLTMENLVAASKTKTIGATLAQAGATAMETLSKGGAIGASLAHVAALISEQLAAWGLNAALAPLVAVILVLVAALASVIAIGALVVSAFNAIKNSTPEAKLKAAEEEAARLSEELNKAREASEQLKSSIEGYDSAIDKIKQLKRGTQEYKDAINEANEKARELIDQNDSLAGKYHFNAENGLIEFDEGALEEAQDIADKKVKTVQAQKLMADNSVLTAQSAVSRKEVVTEGSAKAYQDSANMAIVGAIVPVLGPLLKTAGALKSIGTAIGDVAQNHALKDLQQAFEDNGGNLTKAMDSLSAENQMVIQSLGMTESELHALCAETQVNTQAIIENNKQIVDSTFEDNQDYERSQNKEFLNEVLAEDMTERTDQLYKEQYKDGKMSDADAQKAYAEMMGWDANLVENKSGNKAVYIDDEGNEVTISDEKVRQYLAQQAALDALNGEMSTYAQNVNKLDEKEAELAKQYANGTITYEQYVKEMEKAGEALGMSQDNIDSFIRNHSSENIQRRSREVDLVANIAEIGINDQAAMEFVQDFASKLSNEDLEIAVQASADAQSLDDFRRKFELAATEALMSSYESTSGNISQMLAAADEAGAFSSGDLAALEQDDNFIKWLEENQMKMVDLTAATYTEQYNIIAQFYSDLTQMQYEAMELQQENYESDLAEYQAIMDYKIAQEEGNQQRMNEIRAAWGNSIDFEAYMDLNTDDLQQKLDEARAGIEELTNKQYELSISWDGIDTIEKSFDEMGDFASTIEKDAKKVGDRYQITAAQGREWIEMYPELFATANVTTDGLIELSEDEYKAFAQAEKEKRDEAIKTEIENNKVRLSQIPAERERLQTQINMYKTMSQGKMDLEHATAEDLAAVRGQLTQFYIDSGIDEVKANELALRDMGLTQEQYNTMIADSSEENAANVINGANSTATNVKKLFSNMVDNLKIVFEYLGKAISEAMQGNWQGAKDYMGQAWDAAKNTLEGVKNDWTAMRNGTMDNYQIGGNYTAYKSEAEYNDARSDAIDGIISGLESDLQRLTNEENTLNAQNVYLNSLLNQDVVDYGSTDPDEVDGTKEEEDRDKEEYLDEEIDRYHTLNEEIEALDHNLNMLGKQKEKAFGKNKLALMKQESAELAKMVKKKEELNKAYEADLKSDRRALEKAFVGESFDKDGNLTNYNELKKQAEAEYNAAVTIYNNGAQDDAAKQSLEDAKKAYEEKIKLLEQYEETLDGVRQSEEDALAALQEWQTANFEILNYELELKIDINDDRLEMTDYYLSKMEDDVFSMGESLALMTGDKMNSLLATATAYQEQYAKLTEAFEKGEISEADYFAGLDEIKAGLMDSAQAIQELDQQTIEYYQNTLTAAQEEIDKYVESMDHLSGVLEHYQTIVDMSTLEKNSESYYKKMDKVMEGQLATAENAVAVAKETMDTFQRELEIQEKAYQDALKSGDEETIKIRQEQYEAALKAANDAEEEYLSRVEDYAEKTSEILEYNLKKFANTLEDQLTGGTSFDAMNTGMERFLSLHEEYLTTTNKVYETSKLMRSAQQEIDKTSNTVAKNKMKQFIQETQNLQNQNKLSQFELDIQQAKYDLLVAEIALEEARDAKSQVRLQRDSEGNFGYVYTANQEQVQNAEQEFLDAQNALYNIGLEGANEYVQKYQQTMAEMYDTLTSLAEAYRNGEFESEAEYQAAVQEATEYYYEKLDQYSYLHYQAIQADDRVATDYILSNSNLARTNIHGDTISVGESWRTTFLDISGFGEDAKAALTGQSWDIYQRNKANLGEMKNEALSWKNAVTEYVGNVNGAFTQWKTNISDTVAPAVKNLSKKVDAVVTSSNNFKNALTGENGLIKKLQEEMDKVKSLTDKYIKLRGEIHDALLEAEQLMETIIAQKAAAAGVDDPGSNPNTTTNPTTTNPTTNPTTSPTTSPTTRPTGNGLSFAGLSKAAADLLQGLLNAGFAIAVVKEIMDQHNAEPNGELEDYDAVRTTKQIMRTGSGFINIGEHGIVRDTRNFFGTEQAKVEFSSGRKEWINKDSLTGFATGGYTGNWGGPDGKFALLHQKELVLNKGDTENFLASMEVLDDILKIIDVQSASQLLGRNLSSPTFGAVGSDVLEQNVSIEASFPNATDKQEIEEAFKDLVNLAAQYANRKNK